MQQPESTAPAAQQLDPTLLQVLLQHSNISQDQQLVCSLLCVSSTVQAVVKQHCIGQVPVVFELQSLQAAQLFASWLGRHAALAQSLSLAVPLYRHGPKLEAASAAIRSALQQTAAAPQGLRLQAFAASNIPSLQFVQPLQHCSHIISLTIHSSAQGDHLACALEGLPSLKVLHICGPYYRRHGEQNGGLDPLLPALAGLTSLTSLIWAQRHNPAVLHHLPVQLQRLEFVLGPLNEPNSPLHGPPNMAHLTALTALVCSTKYSHVTVSAPFRVQAGDQLAPALRVLHVRDISAVQPLLALQHLQQLLVTNCTTPAAELRQLSSISSLRDLQLQYFRDTPEPAAAAAWGVLPISEVQFKCCYLPANILQRLGSMRSTLTHLGLCNSLYCAAPQQVAAVLGQLTGLQQLKVVQLHYQNQQQQLGADAQQEQGVEEQPPAAAAAAYEEHVAGQVAVLRTVARLPSLHSLTLSSLAVMQVPVPSAAAAVAELCAATQLTHLALVDAGLGDASVMNLAASLTGLRELDISGNSVVTAGVLMELSCLQQLTQLNVQDTAVTQQGVEQLLAQLPGLSVVKQGGSVARVDVVDISN